VPKPVVPTEKQSKKSSRVDKIFPDAIGDPMLDTHRWRSPLKLGFGRAWNIGQTARRGLEA